MYRFEHFEYDYMYSVLINQNRDTDQYTMQHE